MFLLLAWLLSLLVGDSSLVVGFTPSSSYRSPQRLITHLAATAATRPIVSEELLTLFSKQVTHELAASQLYLAASIWCDKNDLVGMAQFMLTESNEERGHALSFISFANKRNIPIQLDTLPAPKANWKTVENVWEDILKSEQDNTQSLLELGDAAAACNDHAVTAFLYPYHIEQVNSEDNLQTILSKVKDENRTPGLIRQLDTELGGQSGSHSG